VYNLFALSSKIITIQNQIILLCDEFLMLELTSHIQECCEGAHLSLFILAIQSFFLIGSMGKCFIKYHFLSEFEHPMATQQGMMM